MTRVEVEFDVHGRDEADLRERAEAVVRDFFKLETSMRIVDMKMRAEPSVSAFGEDVPAVWTGHVTARS